MFKVLGLELRGWGCLGDRLLSLQRCYLFLLFRNSMFLVLMIAVSVFGGSSGCHVRRVALNCS